MTVFGLTEPVMRFGAFAGILVLMLLLERAFPRRSLTQKRGQRWLTNLAMVGFGGLCVRLMGASAAPLVAVGAAIMAEQQRWGVLHYLDLPFWVEMVIVVVVLDALVWAQHLAFHRYPGLWRIHRMHHADRDIDVSTALRFHPLEIVISMLIKVVAVIVLGADAIAVVAFEVMLNACAMFNHANLRLPIALDRILRRLIVTPDMHRVHHSIHADEHHANFGFNLSIWDRLAGTYCDQPRDGHTGMRIGLPMFQTTAPNSLWWCLRLPFSRDGSSDGG